MKIRKRVLSMVLFVLTAILFLSSNTVQAFVMEAIDDRGARIHINEIQNEEIKQYLTAQGEWEQEGKISQPDTTGKITKSQVSAMITLITGEVDEVGRLQGGLIDDTNNLIASMYGNPPASTNLYVADLLNSAHVIPQAYAQGLGFASLSPVLNTWKTFRNFSYFMFVIIFIVIGFMIMTRSKMGQTAVTVQQAIPKIIVALLLVTFSYAIAGFLVDLMYLLMYLITALLDGDSNRISNDVFELAGHMIVTGFGGAYDSASNIIDEALGGLFFIGDAAAIIGGLAVAAVVALAIAFATFKLFFELLKSYINIIISVALAPLLLMTEAVPGMSSFKKWLKNLIAHLSAFPAVLLILILFDKITGIGESAVGGFMPPFLLGDMIDTRLTGFIVGFGMLMGMPEAVKQVKKMMGASENPFSEVVKAGWDRAKKARRPAMTAAGVPAGVAVGAGLGALRGSWMAARAPAGQRREAFMRNAGRGIAIGAGTGLIGAGGTRYLTQPISKIAGLERDIGAVMQTGERVQTFRRERRRADRQTETPIGATPPTPAAAQAGTPRGRARRQHQQRHDI